MLELQYGREEVVVLCESVEDLVRSENQQIGITFAQAGFHFLPSDGRGNSGIFFRAERIDVDGGLVVVVLAPIDEDFADA